MSKEPFSMRHAQMSDRERIVDFLNRNWGSRHPLVNLSDLFEYYYICKDKLQFVLAEQDMHLVAVAGYILCNASSQPDAWVSIWCAAKGCNGVGLELMEALPRLAGVHVLACNNIRPKTMAFYRFLGWHADRIPHYYRLGSVSEQHLVRGTNGISMPPVGGDLELFPVYSTKSLEEMGVPDTGCVPCKDVWYLRRRYFAFPRQTYRLWAACEEGRIAAYLVTRTVTVNEAGGAKVLRIVDFIGRPEQLPRIGAAINNIMQTENIEYADCYCAGISPALFEKAGFVERKQTDAIVIPNYLDPPLYENTEYYYFTNQPDGFVLFKADGDQDRPNLG